METIGFFILVIRFVIGYFYGKQVGIKESVKTFGVSRGEQDSKEKSMDDIL